jgi:hypothetical protein
VDDAAAQFWQRYWRYHTLAEWQAAFERAHANPIDPDKLTPEQREFWDTYDFGTLRAINAEGDLATPEWRDLDFAYSYSLFGTGEPLEWP